MGNGVGVKTQRDAMIAKSYLMAMFDSEKFPDALASFAMIQDHLHRAFARPQNCNLDLTREQEAKMAEILFDISGGKVVLKRDLAWDGVDNGKDDSRG